VRDAPSVPDDLDRVIEAGNRKVAGDDRERTLTRARRPSTASAVARARWRMPA
jgi:hypothetical protein